jgi:undecaprenyl-diphosphatase
MRRGTALQLGLVALLVTLFIALGIVVKSGRTLALDEHIHRALRGHVPTTFEDDDTSGRTRLMRLGVDVGTATALFVPLTALVLVGLHRRRAALVVILSTGGALVLTLCLKEIFHRTRPEQVCTRGPLCVIDYLYPSNHTVLSLVSYGLIGALIAARLSGWRRALVFLAVVIVVSFVGTSLVYLNTHYFTDVIGGLLIGGAWLIGSLLALRAAEAET